MTEASEWPEWTDFLGNVYRPGDHVVYATCSSSSANLTFARALKINRLDKDGEPIMTSKYDRTLRMQIRDIPHCTVTLQPLEDSRMSWRDSNAKKVTIQNIDNIVKVESSYITAFEAIKAQYRTSDSNG